MSYEDSSIRSGHVVHSHVSSTQRLTAALALITAFLLFEVVFAFVGSSLALLADAGHMLADAGALAASVWAARLAIRPPEGPWTFGLKRAEILSAQANGITLLVLGVLIGFVAVERLFHPPAVQGTVVLVVASVGIVVNLAAANILRGSARQSLNVEGSFRHIVTDLFAFVATLIAGLVVVTTGFNRADAVASLVVVVLMLRAAYGLLRDSGRILLEGVPAGLSVEKVGRDLASQPLVAEVHDVHVWTITSGFPALAAHVLVEQDSDCHAIRRSLEALVLRKYGIDHTTLQVDHASDGLIPPASLIGPGHRHSNTKVPRDWSRRG